MATLDRATLASLFLARLARLAVQEAVARTAQERFLVAWAISSTCFDCYALGLTREARRILAARYPRRQDEA